MTNPKRLLRAALVLFCLCFSLKTLAWQSADKSLQDTLVLELSGSSRLLIPVRSVGQPGLSASINALVRRLNQDAAKISDTLVNPKYTVSVWYRETGDGGRTLKVTANTTERSVLYVTKETGIIKTRLNPDSVVAELPGTQKLFFILDSLPVLRQLESRDLDGLLARMQGEIAEELAMRRKRNLIDYNGPRFATYQSLPDGSRKLHLGKRTGETDQFAVFANTGVGLVRDKLVPEIGLGFAIITRRNLYMGLTSSMHYFFDRQESGKYGMAINTFVTLEVAKGIGPNPRLWNKIGVSYLVNRQGNYFGNNTWKLSMNLVTKPKYGSLHLIPELIITDNFRTAFPGIRVGVGF